ncbi:hypothetical protein [Paenibacillus pinihumi]|uniref:hypothetical protein n=1 Tax=Paenibacillus pinihumi TaxID=669462 RepID=UPI0003F9C44A|nr:hypothetical protein [Paenibacillus pinihumi]
MEIGRKLYYDRSSGDVIVDTGQRAGSVVPTTVEQDYAAYRALAVRLPDTVGLLQLGYGDYGQDFAECIGYRVDPDTEQVLFLMRDK